MDIHPDACCANLNKLPQPFCFQTWSFAVPTAMWKLSETVVSTTTVSPKMTLSGSARTAVIVAPAMKTMKMKAKLSIKVSTQNKRI